MFNKHVELFFACCNVVHPLHNFRANNALTFNEISKCLPTFVLRKTQTFLHRFTANITRCLQASSTLFFGCFDVVHPLHNFLEPITTILESFNSKKHSNYGKHNKVFKISKCLPTFVLRKTQTFLHRFTANITKCLKACRIVFCLL